MPLPPIRFQDPETATDPEVRATPSAITAVAGAGIGSEVPADRNPAPMTAKPPSFLIEAEAPAHESIDLRAPAGALPAGEPLPSFGPRLRPGTGVAQPARPSAATVDLTAGSTRHPSMIEVAEGNLLPIFEEAALAGRAGAAPTAGADAAFGEPEASWMSEIGRLMDLPRSVPLALGFFVLVGTFFGVPFERPRSQMEDW